MDNLIKKDLKYIWHPYTQMKDTQHLPPILIRKAKGLKLYDGEGNFYYDTISSWWCNTLGHNHPRLKKALFKQLNLLEHTLFAGFTHQPAIELAEELVSLTPRHLKKVFYSDNGSTAIEVALKMSYQFWQNTGKKNKKKFVHLDYAYHGDTLGAMSVGGSSIFNEPFRGLFFKTYTAKTPYCYRCPVNKKYPQCEIACIKFLEKIFKNHHQEIAAFIIEPLILGAGGMIIYPKEYLIEAAQLCKKYNIHLILDEVATGFGRTAKMFASSHTPSVKADFMCLSKALTAGYLPLAATLTTEKIYFAFYDDYQKKKTFYHGHTYTANPLACAVAVENLKIFKEDNVLERIREIASFFHKKLQIFFSLKIVGDIRYLGVVGALELVREKKNKTPFSFKERIGFKIYQEGLKEGLLLRPLGNIIYFFLPYCIRKKEIALILEKTYKIIKKFT